MVVEGQAFCYLHFLHEYEARAVGKRVLLVGMSFKIVPRLQLNRFIEPDKLYRFAGEHKLGGLDGSCVIRPHQDSGNAFTEDIIRPDESDPLTKAVLKQTAGIGMVGILPVEKCHHRARIQEYPIHAFF